jgi:OOP family OmpA-OmpF porin
VPVPLISPVVTIPPPKLDVYTGYIPSIYGAFNSTDLTYPSFNALDSVIMVMNDHPDTRIRITAHTDNRGSKAVNMKLSKQRAQVVKEYLMQNGIHANRIETRGLGAEQPIAENDSAEGRSMNRRVDFEIINKP